MPVTFLTNEDEKKYVKSFNGVKPDPETGDVAITIPESGGNAEDGFSPIATVEQTSTGAVISITDKDGTTTATITNGKDGKDGADGQPGKDGADGQPGKDGADGAPGAKGEKGDPGEKGDKGDTGATGAQGEPGKDGANGKDGYTPVMGVDYWTEEDQAAIWVKISDNIAEELAKRGQLKPEFADSLEWLNENGDTSKLYVLPDGYIYAYVTGEGASFTNQIEKAIDTDGTPYNSGLGYKEGWRFNSSKQEVEAEGQLITGYIPYTTGQVIRISGFNTSDKPNGYFQTCYGDFNVGFNGQMQQMDGNANGLTYGPDPIVSGAYMLTIDPAAVTDEYLGPALRDSNPAYIRVNISGYNLSALKVTLDEEISCGTTRAWMNTGHAFIPGDYEDRFATIEEQIASLAEGGNTLIPDYVITEAESVLDRVIAAQGDRTFTFAALTDMHYGVWNYSAGVDHACQALKYISERINLDAVAVLGDYTDGYPDSGYDDAVADFRAVNNILDDLRDVPNLRLAGNHDIYNENPALTMRYINAYSDDVVWGSREGGYYYRDFGGYKIRVIGLNTSMVTTEQYNWFVSALDLTDKEDVSQWSILVISHHPLDWYPEDETYRFCYILDGYRNGTSGDADGIAYDFTGGRNAAKLIGNIHGHIHNFKVDYIHRGNVVGGDKTSIYRIATPNSCYNRENEYEGAWADDTAYHKTQNSAEDTSFCVYCIDLDACTIKAVCYGAGYDREVSYQYDNDVTPPTVEPEKVSWNDLTDKPFGEEMTETKVDTLVKSTPDDLDDTGVWKFSDNVPTLEDMSNGIVVNVSNANTGYNKDYTSEEFGSPFAQDDGIVFATVDWTMYIAPFDGAVVWNETIPTAGIYFDDAGFNVGEIVTLTIPGYEFTTTVVGTKKLDEKYIPDTIARKTDIPEQNTEEWVFELADGTTVTKQVVVV